MNTLVSALNPAAPSLSSRINYKPLIVSLVLLAIGANYLNQEVGWRQSSLWIVGALLGVTLYHASFGFTQAWRVFVSDGRGAGLRAQMVMLALGVVLFFPCLAQGSLFGQHVSGIVAPASLSVVIGAFVFGIGMQLGGGCASGTLFAVGGGSTRMIITLFSFVAGSVLATINFTWWATLPSLPPTSLVKEWGWPVALAANLVVFALIYWLTTRIEKRRHGALVKPAGIERKPLWQLIRGPWPLVWGAIALVLLNFATLAISGRPWGITSAFTLWGAKALDAGGSDVAFWQYWANDQDTLFAPIRQDVTSVMDIGIMLGALAAASLAGRFAPIWKVPFRSLLAAILGGLMLGFGARLGWGCNIGAYFSGMISGSLHAWIWLPSAFMGSILGVRLRPLFGLSVEKTQRLSAC
ncbi:YeeE/YedE family protein [Paralcaligenes sp. KSB-10]|uniref:YeeE/YedE family protein n=1 Tax=Paralcaligenes sp. KSB-10 TaxID=2901142 RepID=UPI001E56915D|nr:YeeE/YedE family protein [Paralcaligenes sp. KSB-10]UHL64444.1 YeeE/YedE family protein [Paralcaligenes sp. KSB-10]